MFVKATSDSVEANVQTLKQHQKKQKTKQKQAKYITGLLAFSTFYKTHPLKYLLSLARKRAARREGNTEASGWVGARDYYSHLLVLHCSYIQKDRPETTAANKISCKERSTLLQDFR